MKRSILFIILIVAFLKYSYSTQLKDSFANKIKEFPEIPETKRCSVTQPFSRSLLKCTVDLTYKKEVESEGPEGCYKNWDNNLIVTVNELIQNITFGCVSNTPIDARILFEYEATIVHYTEIRRERLWTKFHEPTSYEYKLKISVPASPLIYRSPKATTAVKYQIFEIGRDVHVNILFYILEYNWNLEKNFKVHWMKEQTEIQAQNEIINVPCISLSNEMGLFQRINQSLHKVDPVAVNYDMYNGLSVNTSLLSSLSGDYVCVVKNVTNISELFTLEYLETDFIHNFSIALPDDIFIDPPKKIIEHDDLYDLQYTQQNYILLCTSRNGNASIVIDRNVSLSGNLDITITNTEITKPERRSVSKAVLSYVSWDECKKDWTGRNCHHDVIFVGCVIQYDRKEKYVWSWDIRTKISYTDEEYEFLHILPLRYEKKENNFICEPFNSHSQVKDLSIQHVHCNNHFQCRQLSKCLHYVGLEGDDLNVIRKSCINSLTTLAKTPCELGITDEGVPVTACQVAKPLVSTKGVLQCVAKRDNGNSDFCQDTYFEGFDRNLYGNMRNHPVNSTIQLLKLHTDKVYHTGGKFIFRCQAHSFFYEQGILWFFNYNNSNDGSPSLRQIPNEYIKYIESGDNLSGDVYTMNDNPTSTVEITFDTNSIKQVACAAPIIYSKTDKHLLFVDVDVKDSYAPTIRTDNASIIEFAVGDTGRSITCHAEAFPIPQIKWMFNGTVIEENVVDRVVAKLLLFPIFDETMIGKYTCIASNLAGVASKSFQINALKQEDSNNILPITISFSSVVLVLLIICASTIYVCRRNQRNKRYKELMELRELLEGYPENPEMNEDSEDIEDPILTLPYNKSLELKRDSFFIDKKQLLGKGNFGEVYKGRVDGSNGHFAFKTLRRDSKVSEFRSLVYELKILTYIGKHEHIVQLVAAYTKDILEGCIYLATELCSMGSIQEFLRSNRDTFIQNIKRSQHKDSSTNTDTKQQNIPICSYQRLILWCGQIASAMEFLEFKKVVHGDMAARNVLLTGDGVAKVTDFGRSRRLDSDRKYIKRSEDDMPWQWLAIEAIKMNEYSVESDVWAYGITLFEIFSLGETPYPRIQPPENQNELIHFWSAWVENLENGTIRNKKPKYALPQIYQIMENCWKIDPKSRPSFTSLKMEFQTNIDDWSRCDFNESEDSENTSFILVQCPNSNYSKVVEIDLSTDESDSDRKVVLAHPGYVAPAFVSEL